MLLFIFFKKLKTRKNELTKGKSLSLKFVVGVILFFIGGWVTVLMFNGWLLIDPSQVVSYDFMELGKEDPGNVVRLTDTSILFTFFTLSALIYLLVWEEIKIFDMRWRDWFNNTAVGQKLNRFFNKEKK